MQKPLAFPIVPIAAGALLCAAGIGLLWKADVATRRLMQATGVEFDVPQDVAPPALEPEVVERIAHWSLPVHTLGLCLFALGAWLQVRALREPKVTTLDEYTQRLLAEWVLARAALELTRAPTVSRDWRNALQRKVLDYLIARYTMPGATVAASPPRPMPAAPSAAAATARFRRLHRGVSRQLKDPMIIRPALNEIQRLNRESYASFGFSEQAVRGACNN
jgi:hypothetical protein